MKSAQHQTVRSMSFRQLVRGVFLFCSLLIMGNSCNKLAYNYSTYPQGCVMKGELKDGNTLYLIRENDSTHMSGHGFILEQQSIANLVSYHVYPTGIIYFNINDFFHLGKVRLNKKGPGMKLNVPSIAELGIKRQTIDMKYWDVIDNKVVCPQRYYEQKFDSIAVLKNIQYGTAPGFYTSEPVDTVRKGDTQVYKELILKDIKQATTGRDTLPLLMDIYYPYDVTDSPKPVFMFIHGGGFFFGDKENRLQQALTEDFVKRGYVVVSIDYRLGSTIFGVKSVEKLIYSGVQDARAALRYITHNSEELGIDPNQIYIGGSSAGAIISLYTAYMDDDEVFKSAERKHIRKELGDINSSGNNLKDRYKIAGVISMWGAVVDLDIIDWRNADIPLLLFHGTADNIVPIDSGLPYQQEVDRNIYNRLSTRWRLYGSESIYNHMNDKGMPVKLFTFEGYGHEPQVNADGTYNNNINTIKQEMKNFMYRGATKKTDKYYSIMGEKDIYPGKDISLYTIKNGEGTSIKWVVEGGLVVERTANTAKIIWYDVHQEGKINVCITDESGGSESLEMKVKIHPANP